MGVNVGASAEKVVLLQLGVNAGASAEKIGVRDEYLWRGGVGDGAGAGSAHNLDAGVCSQYRGGVGVGAGAGSAHKLEVLALS